jgi:choline dehydrogenase-like flavoprotein
VTLRSADPLSKPRLVHNYMVSEADRKVMRGGVRRILELFDTPAYREHVTGPYMAPASRSDEDIEAYVRHEGLTSYHQSSSCAIGPVLDAELRVHGFEGLRVVDASAMPDCMGSNTTAPTTMIAEKGADMIRGIDSRQPPQTAAASA